MGGQFCRLPAMGRPVLSAVGDAVGRAVGDAVGDVHVVDSVIAIDSAGDAGGVGLGDAVYTVGDRDGVVGDPNSDAMHVVLSAMLAALSSVVLMALSVGDAVGVGGTASPPPPRMPGGVAGIGCRRCCRR